LFQNEFKQYAEHSIKSCFPTSRVHDTKLDVKGDFFLIAQNAVIDTKII